MGAVVRLPRLRSRGSIEGIRPLPQLACPPSFRGFAAAAPLKDEDVRLPCLLPDGFRGFAAAAPLKDEDVRLPCLLPDGFRGFAAAAPLKEGHLKLYVVWCEKAAEARSVLVESPK